MKSLILSLSIACYPMFQFIVWITTSPRLKDNAEGGTHSSAQAGRLVRSPNLAVLAHQKEDKLQLS
jgi:hypothetical protein